MKKGLSILLALVMSLSFLSALPMSATAKVADLVETGTLKTQNEAIDWVRSLTGSKVGSGECVALINAYYNYLEGYSVYGHAKDYQYNDLPDGWYRTGTPSPGDIVVWGPGAYEGKYAHYANSEFGHIGIVSAVYDGYIDYYDQNSSHGQIVWLHEGHEAQYAATYIHPNFYNPYPYVDFNKDFMIKIIKMNDWLPMVNEGTNAEIGKESGNANEYWWVARQPDRSFTIRSMADGKYLDVDCSQTSNGTNIHVYNGTHTENQSFYFKATDNGYLIIPKIATSSCLDVQGDGKTIGTNIHLWEQNGTMAQRFALCEYPNVPEFENIGTDFAATVLQTTKWIPIVNNNTEVELGTEHGYANERWWFARQNDGTYTIKSMEDGKYLDLDCSVAENGRKIHVYNQTNTDNQKYYLQKTDQGGYRFIPKCAPYHCLDVASGKISVGTGIQLWTPNGTEAQRFSIYTFNGVPDFKNFGDNFTATLKTIDNRFALSNKDSAIIAAEAKGQMNTFWAFQRNLDGTYSIKSMSDNTYIETSKGDDVSNTIVYTNTFTGKENQRFFIEEENGYIRIIPKNALSLCAGIEGDLVNSGMEYKYLKKGETATQKLLLTKVNLLLGDVDGDEKVTIIDATYIQRKLASISTATFIEATFDSDGDGGLTIIDATLIQRHLAQLPAPEAIGKSIN